MNKLFPQTVQNLWQFVEETETAGGESPAPILPIDKKTSLGTTKAASHSSLVLIRCSIRVGNIEASTHDDH